MRFGWIDWMSFKIVTFLAFFESQTNEKNVACGPASHQPHAFKHFTVPPQKKRGPDTHKCNTARSRVKKNVPAPENSVRFSSCTFSLKLPTRRLWMDKLCDVMPTPPSLSANVQEKCATTQISTQPPWCCACGWSACVCVCVCCHILVTHSYS